MAINVIISSDSRYSIKRPQIEEAVVKTLTDHNLRGEIEVEVVIVGDRKAQTLNKQYRNMDYTPDVLTFAFEDPHPQNPDQKTGFVSSPDSTLRLGSILISYPQAVLGAVEDGITVDDEIKFLVEHGCNHLLGIHHE